jgi:ComF family protein
MLEAQKTPQAQLQNTPGLFASFGRQLLDLIFPPRCVHCGRIDAHWCADCTADLQAVSINSRTQTTSLPHLTIRSSGEHDGILQHAIQGLKYHGVQDLAMPLAARLIPLLPGHADAIVPVPMHSARYRQRGYNQAALLAAALAEQTGIPLYDSLLQRTRATRTQVGLNRAERLENVSGAFQAYDTIVGTNVVLVDDVYTTGATLIGCAQALTSVQAVFGLTVTTATKPL